MAIFAAFSNSVRFTGNVQMSLGVSVSMARMNCHAASLSAQRVVMARDVPGSNTVPPSPLPVGQPM